jgi:trigger factor
MEVQVENTGGLARRVRVTIASERVERAFEDRLKNIASRVRLPGFRPGKAPMKVIRQQYAASARAEAVTDLVRETWPQAITQAGVAPAGAPDFEVQSDRVGEGLAYTASFEVLPEIKLEKLDLLEIKKPSVNINDDDVSRLIDNLRKARRTWSPVSRAAATGDQVVLDFNGKLDGVEFQGGKGEKVEIELGTGQFLPDLEQSLAGHSAGDSYTVDVHFPADYRAENLRDKTAQFDVVVHEVKEAQLPAIDDEFLKAHGVAEGAGEEGLRVKCRTALETERDKATRARVKQQALDQLLQHHPIDVPAAMVAEEIERLREQAVGRMGLERNGKLTPEKKAQMLPAAIFEANAQRRVALGLLVGEAIRVRDVKLDAARVEQALGEVAADYEEPEEVKQYYRSQQQLMQGLRAVVLEDQLVENLVAGAKVEEVSLSLEDLLKQQQAA